MGWYTTAWGFRPNRARIICLLFYRLRLLFMGVITQLLENFFFIYHMFTSNLCLSYTFVKIQKLFLAFHPGAILTNIDCTAWVGYTFFVTITRVAKIMCWTPTICLTIKEIKIFIKCRPRTYPKDRRGWIMAFWCHMFNVLTAHWPILLCDQASTTWPTNNPIIDCWFDQYIVPNILPKTVVYSTSWDFTERRGGWNGNVGSWGGPGRTRGDSIAGWTKAVVIGKCITVNQRPTSPVCFHIAVNFKIWKWWTRIGLDPIYSWRCKWWTHLNVQTRLSLVLHFWRLKG